MDKIQLAIQAVKSGMDVKEAAKKYEVSELIYVSSWFGGEAPDEIPEAAPSLEFFITLANRVLDKREDESLEKITKELDEKQK